MDLAKWKLLAKAAPYTNRKHNIKTKTKKEQLTAVKQNGGNIKYIHNPCEEAQLAAVKQNGNSIKFIHNPCEEAQLTAVKQDGDSIQYIRDPCERAWMLYWIGVCPELLMDPSFDLKWEG